MTVAQVEDPFPRPGDTCQSCRSFWDAQGLATKTLVAVHRGDGDPMSTANRGIPITVCPFCDGEIILKLEKD